MQSGSAKRRALYRDLERGHDATRIRKRNWRLIFPCCNAIELLLIISGLWNLLCSCSVSICLIQGTSTWSVFPTVPRVLDPMHSIVSLPLEECRCHRFHSSSVIVRIRHSFYTASRLKLQAHLRSFATLNGTNTARRWTYEMATPSVF